MYDISQVLGKSSVCLFTFDCNMIVLIDQDVGLFWAVCNISSQNNWIDLYLLFVSSWNDLYLFMMSGLVFKVYDPFFPK